LGLANHNGLWAEERVRYITTPENKKKSAGKAGDPPSNIKAGGACKGNNRKDSKKIIRIRK